MIPRLSYRASTVHISATAAVREAARAFQAGGGSIVNLSAGEPDFSTPAVVIEEARRASQDSRYHRYAPTAGLPELREAVASYRSATYLDAPNAQDVVITCGAKQAAFNSMLAILDPGDEVIIPSPCWVSYPAMVSLAGGRPVVVATQLESGFKITVDQLEAASTPRTRALVLVSPGNPTGAVYSPHELREIGKWAVARGIWVISDEIYGELVYDGLRPTSIIVEVPDLREQCVVIHGVSKSFAMTGWRVGWLIGPQRLVKAVTAIQSHSTSHTASVAQAAAVAALTLGYSALEGMRSAYELRRNQLVQAMSGCEQIELFKPQGAFYAFPRWVSPMGNADVDDVELAGQLLTRAGVATVPGSSFAAPSHLRLSFAASDADLAEGVRRILAMTNDSPCESVWKGLS